MRHPLALGSLALTLVLALPLGCAAPADEVGESQGAMEVADGSVSAAEAQALRGEGLTGCAEEVEGATLCTHRAGLVVMSAEGFALLRADGDVITAKASAWSIRSNDVNEVLAAASGPGSESATASLRPLGGPVANLAANLLRRLADKLSGATARAVAHAGETEVEIAAVRSTALAGDLGTVTQTLKAGERAALTDGASLLGGVDAAAVTRNARRFFGATNRRTLGLVYDLGDPMVSRDVVRRFHDAYLTKELAALKPGERLTLVVAEGRGHDSFRSFVREMSLPIDVVLLRAPNATYVPTGWTAVIDAAPGMWHQGDGELRAIAGHAYGISSRGVRSL